MKNIFLSAITVAFFMISCTTNTEDLAGLETLSLDSQDAITSYVKNNFPDTEIEYSEVSRGTVTAELNTGEILKFSTEGVFMAYSNNISNGIKADSLRIRCDSTYNDSIHSGKRGDKGDKGGKKGDKGGKGGKGGKHGDRHGNDSTSTNDRHGRHSENKVELDSLSAEIATYIASNYLGYSALHAETDTVCEGAVTKVMIAIANAQPLKLVFNSENVYLYKAERINFADAPTHVIKAITEGYSAYTVAKRCELYTMADNTLKYAIYIRQNNNKQMLTFNADGSLSCSK